jgi:hypothetical protein
MVQPRYALSQQVSVLGGTSGMANPAASQQKVVAAAAAAAARIGPYPKP